MTAPIDTSTLPAGVATTFTHSCAYGCTIRTVDSVEQPHVCVGEQVIAALAPELKFATAKRITEGLKPLVRELCGDSWEDGVRSGRTGLPCVGVDDVAPAVVDPPRPAGHTPVA